MANRLLVQILPRNQTIGSAVRYIMGEGRDRKTGRPKELEPGQQRRAEIVGSNGFTYNITDGAFPVDETAERAGWEMEALQDRGTHPGPRANDLQHISVSWPPKAHMTLDELLAPEQPSNEHMTETARGVLRALGMDRAKALFVRHRDTPHPHMHIVASRIDPETGIKFVSQRDYNRERINVQKFARQYELEHQRELERIPERSLANDNQPWMAPLQQLWRQNVTEFQEKDDRTKSIERALDRQEMQGRFRQWNESTDPEWRRITEGSERARDLQHPDNFDEFAAARGLGRLDPREAEKIKNDQANERMLSDFDYFSKLDRDKPERTPALEHQNENTEGMPFYSPAGAKVVNRVLNEREPTDWSELEPVEKATIKRDRLERGMGREMDIFGFDDGSTSGESGYGGE